MKAKEYKGGFADKEYQAYMRRWMADHPGPWVQCGFCGNWRLDKHPDRRKRCAQCPPKPPEGWPQRKEHMRGRHDRRDWGHYAD